MSNTPASKAKYGACSPLTIAVSLCAAVLFSGCDSKTLDTGDSLILSAQPGFVFVRPAMSPNIDTVAGQPECLAAGGTVVSILAIHSDGSVASGADVAVWLDPAGSAHLLKLGSADADANGAIVAHLDERGSGDACLIPGTLSGSVTVHARSGVVSSSEDIKVSGSVLPNGSSLKLTLDPISTSVVVPSQGSICGVPAAAACIPGAGRKASIAVTAATAADGPDIPDGMPVTLVTSAGWLSADGGCAGDAIANQLSVPLTAKVAQATWCFGDLGGGADVTAVSGEVSATGHVDLHVIPSSLTLWADQTTVPDGGIITLTAEAVGCDGVGIPDLPISFSVSSDGGSVSFTGGTSATTTGANGTATLQVAVTGGAARITGQLVETPIVSCGLDVEVSP